MESKQDAVSFPEPIRDVLTAPLLIYLHFQKSNTRVSVCLQITWGSSSGLRFVQTTLEYGLPSAPQSMLYAKQGLK